MANEAELRVKHSVPDTFTVANANGIEKGTLLKGSDPRTAAATSSSDVDVAFCGIARREKIASDGRTVLAVFRPGGGDIFDLTLAGGATAAVGSPVIISGANLISGAPAGSGFSNTFGYVLETGSSGEKIQVRV